LAKRFITHVHGTTKGILQAFRKIFPTPLNKETKKQRITRALSILKEMIMWRNADAVIVNSEFLKNDLTARYGVSSEKIHVIYNGFDSQTFYPRKTKEKIFKALGLDSNSYLILYLGGFRQVKGPLFVVKALEKVADRFKDIKVLFVGGSHPLDRTKETTIMDSMRKLERKKALIMADNIPHYLLPEYYSAADALVLPSIYDSFPKVVLEAMACKTPVIASAMGGVLEIIKNGETGILVEPANPGKMAEAIVALISDPALKRRLSSNAKKVVDRHFTWRHNAEQTLMFYRSLI
jgi:spore coat protein SA